jgi:hypothetical protein
MQAYDRHGVSRVSIANHRNNHLWHYLVSIISIVLGFDVKYLKSSSVILLVFDWCETKCS